METKRRFLISVILLLVLTLGFYPAPSPAMGATVQADPSLEDNPAQAGPPTGDNVSKAPRTAGPAGATRLSPDEAVAAAMGSAAYPEIGANDFRISFMGQDTLYDAFRPAVAYNSTEDEYLVVWHGDDNSGQYWVDGEYEIYGQRVDAATGAEIGADFRISDVGPYGDAAYDAHNPAVAYNSTDNQYLVVWYGDDDTLFLVDGEYEIFGRRLDAEGNAVDANEFRISDMGPDGDTTYDALHPAVAYNSTNNEYLVVWYGDDNTALLVNGEYEIFGQRLDANGLAVGANDFCLSDMGPDGDTDYDALYPAVAYNSLIDEYLVVWYGDDDTGSLVDGESEIYGQRVNANGAEVYPNDFRVSDMGADGDTTCNAYDPAVAYNSTDNEYLVVWEGDDDTGALVDGESEIYGQRVNLTGTEVGTNDFRISDMGPDGDADYDAENPTAAYNSRANEYLVVWHADDDTGTLADNEREIFGQRVNANGTEAGDNDFCISDMGPDGDTDYDAIYPAVAYNSAGGEYLVVWEGDDDTAPLVDNEREIFGQRLTATGDGTGSNDFRLSDMGGDAQADASYPAVAYNSTDDEYLVVWQGDDGATPLVDNEYEIFGRRLDATTGDRIGPAFRISDMGPDGDATYEARYPAVAYNSKANEYLVVWEGDDDTGALVDGEFEIYSQRLSATGVEMGTNDFRISDMGPDGNVAYGASCPAVAYNSQTNEYLVVWEGGDDTGSLVHGEFEIFGQMLAANGAELGYNDFRISDMGPDGNENYDAHYPAVASDGSRYLVVWSGDDNTDGEFEVYGQRLNLFGSEIGDNDFRISDAGSDGDTDYDAGDPAVAYNSQANEYLVVWHGDDNTAPLVKDELEIFGQRLSTNGEEVGANDFRISDMGPDGDVDYYALDPAMVYNSQANEYLVVWPAGDDTGSLAEDELEIYGQRLSATGAAVGTNDFRLSDMGPDGDARYNARHPAVAYNSTGNESLAVWDADDDTTPLIDGEFEIFGQRFIGSHMLCLPLALRNHP